MVRRSIHPTISERDQLAVKMVFAFGDQSKKTAIQ
jgi:hypothetical protein